MTKQANTDTIKNIEMIKMHVSYDGWKHIHDLRPISLLLAKLREIGKQSLYLT